MGVDANAIDGAKAELDTLRRRYARLTGARRDLDEEVKQTHEEGLRAARRFRELVDPTGDGLPFSPF